MKIVCESCGAKYSIADEKVAGKVFKIRCKKCSAVIVVKGESPEGNEESTRVYDHAGEAVWHVVVAGEQQGPFTPQQIGELMSDAKIDWEAYVWREGMDGWQPAREVDLLRAALSSQASAAAPAAASGGGGSASAAYGTGQVFGGSSDMGADPFAASDDGGLGSVISQPAARSGDDLFAKSARSPFSGAAGDEEERVSGSQASARSSAGQAMTGQRNENSVLFSLSNLQALATGSGGAPVTTAARPGMAVGEGSGLIDIRALASATQAVAERPNGSSRDKVEDLLSVGSGAAGFSATHFAAPVAAEKPDNSKLVLGGMFAAILVLGGAVGYLVLREQPAAQQTMVAAGPEGTPQAQANPGAATQAAATPTPDAPRAAEPEPAGGAGEPSSEEREREREKSGSHSSSGKKPSSRESSGKASEREREPAAATAAPEPAPAPKKPAGDQSIDDLLSGALGAKAAPKPAAAAKPAADLPATPSRDDVLSAMKGITSKVSDCAKGAGGIATAKIGVTGSTGRVTSVDVSGQHAGTPIAACVAREVGKAKFPKFANPTFSFTYPFKL